jgi:hypothetical protein
MEGFLPQASLLLGIIPALLILLISLKGYEDHYKDKTLFIVFVIGIIIGFVTGIVRSLFLPLVIIVMILLAFFEQLFKTIVLNLGRLQLKKETTIYGLTLGLGFGTVYTPFLIIAASTSNLNDIYSVILITIGSIGIILFHGATGAYIGHGIFTGKLIKYLLFAIIIQLPFNVIIDSTRFYQNEYFTILQIGLVIYGLIIFWYVLKRIMPQILIESKGRKRSNK